MKSRAAISQTADLFAATAFAPVLAPTTASEPMAMPAPTALLEPRSASRPALESLRAAGIPPAPQTAEPPRARQLWHAVVFPELVGDAHSTIMLQRLSLSAQQFTSFVSIEPPNALLLEIRGSVKLFGSLQTLLADIDAAWRRLALRTCAATTPSTLAALWLARAGKRIHTEDIRTLSGHLAELPIACTAWDIDRLQTLRAMGVTRMGELLRLPRAGLARRLGPATVLDLDMALARQAAPRRAFVPRERFWERCDFETEIEHAAYLETALDPLIGRCAQFLRERQAGVLALELRLRHRVGPATRLRLGLASITGERRRMTDVLVQKLSGFKLPAPVRGMELKSGSLQPLSAGSLDAFAGGGAGGQDGPSQCGGRKPKPTPAGRPPGEGQDGPSQLVERLRARLGEAAVYGLRSIPEHRPEAAWQRIYELRLASARRLGERRLDQMPRPVWLLDEPVRLSEPQAQPLNQSTLILEQGPERIESGWWDGKDVTRDYYIARQIHGARRVPGARLWVFQERRSRCWFLHGMFA